MEPADQAFVVAFRDYLKWVEAGTKDPDEPRVRMLEAFGEFLKASGIGPEKKVHSKFLDKMAKFAKGVRGGP